MAEMHSIAGERIYISSAAISDKDTDFVEGDFSSVTWIEIPGWTQRGQFGDTSTVVTSDQIGRPRVKKAKGTANAGTMENVFDRNDGDAGQAKLKAARASSDNYAFRVLDPLRTGESTPAAAMFIGLVMSAPRNSGGPNDPDRISCSIEINSNIVEVAAT